MFEVGARYKTNNLTPKHSGIIVTCRYIDMDGQVGGFKEMPGNYFFTSQFKKIKEGKNMPSAKQLAMKLAQKKVKIANLKKQIELEKSDMEVMKAALKEAKKK